MLPALSLSLALINPAAAAEAERGPGLAVGAATFGGVALGGAAGFGAGIGLAQVACSANGQPDGAFGCVLGLSAVGAGLGALGGAAGSSTWMAHRKGLDPKYIRRRVLIATGISAAACLFPPVGLPALLIGVPVYAGVIANRGSRVAVAPVLGSEAQANFRGLQVTARF